MKTRLRIFGLILSCLLVVFMAACARDTDDRVGTYTLIHVEVEAAGEVESVSPPDIAGTLIFHSDESLSLNYNIAGNRGSGSGTWTSNTFTTNNGTVVPYSFDGSTIEFTLNVDGVNFTYTWQKT